MPEQNSTPVPATPALSFAVRFIKRNGRLICHKCEAGLRLNDFPHDCRKYARPYGAR